MLNDLGIGTAVGVEIGYTTIGDGEAGSFNMSAYHLDLVGDIAIGPNVELFGRVPLMMAVPEDDPLIGDIDSDSGLGNIMLGGRMIVPSGSVEIGLNGAIYLPTADELDFTDEDGLSTYAGFIGNIPRDPAKFYPDTLCIRPGVSGRIPVAGHGYFQVDASLLMLFYSGDQDLDDEQANFLHVTFGGAFPVTQNTAIVAELATLGDVFDEGDDGIVGEENDWMHSLELGVRQELGRMSLGARVYFPLEEELRDQEIIGVGVELLGRM